MRTSMLSWGVALGAALLCSVMPFAQARAEEGSAFTVALAPPPNRSQWWLEELTGLVTRLFIERFQAQGWQMADEKQIVHWLESQGFSARAYLHPDFATELGRALQARLVLTAVLEDVRVKKLYDPPPPLPPDTRKPPYPPGQRSVAEVEVIFHFRAVDPASGKLLCQVQRRALSEFAPGELIPPERGGPWNEALATRMLKEAIDGLADEAIKAGQQIR